MECAMAQEWACPGSAEIIIETVTDLKFMHEEEMYFPSMKWQSLGGVSGKALWKKSHLDKGRSKSCLSEVQVCFWRR